MTSLHEEIIKNLNNRLLHQAIVIDILCGVLIDSNIISEKKKTKKHRICNNIFVFVNVAKIKIHIVIYFDVVSIFF